MHHVERRFQPGRNGRTGRQLADDVVISRRGAFDKNTKARLDAELLYNGFAG
jgi:hypothetical protein